MPAKLQAAKRENALGVGGKAPAFFKQRRCGKGEKPLKNNRFSPLLLLLPLVYFNMKLSISTLPT